MSTMTPQTPKGAPNSSPTPPPKTPTNTPPAKRRKVPIATFLGSFSSFAQVESLSGIVLIATSAVALLVANSPWDPVYEAILHTPLHFELANFAIEMDLLHWINDALMAVFFLVVGLEIKREIVVGELATLRKATLPIAAAAGGMIAPALIYLSLNRGTPAEIGWGVPIATDIAFALGILALLGRRVPLSLKIFLTALAIIDDLGAVIVIALFYTSNLAIEAIGGALVVFALLVIINALGVHSRAPYVFLGLLLWCFVLFSGVHATVAGVMLAMTIPVRARIDTRHFADEVERAIRSFGVSGSMAADVPTTIEQRTAIRQIELAADYATSPLHRLEATLHNWSAFFILPVFALANAGVRVVDMDFAEAITNPITVGIALGLFIGDQVGVFGASWLAVRMRIAELPAGVTWRHIYGVGVLAGIGFTMSLFITNLAFDSAPEITAAKLGIVIGSFVSGLWGYLVLRRAGSPIVYGEYTDPADEDGLRRLDNLIDPSDIVVGEDGSDPESNASINWPPEARSAPPSDQEPTA